MSQSLMEAYAEVDSIIDSMEEQYINEIPEKLRKMFKDNKASNYSKVIFDDIPLEKQNLKEETLTILAILNYQYWCKDENKKKELLKLYSENEKKYQEQMSQKFNYEDLFANSKKEAQNIITEETNSSKEEVLQNDNLALVEIKPTFLLILVNKIKSFLHIK